MVKWFKELLKELFVTESEPGYYELIKAFDRLCREVGPKEAEKIFKEEGLWYKFSGEE